MTIQSGRTKVKGLAIVAAVALASGAVPAIAQQPAAGDGQRTARAAVAPSRYQIGQMERLLEGAVEHGAAITRDRLQSVLPTETLLTENSRVRGFRLDGYGVFFDVEVPALLQTLPWTLRTLDQNDLGLQNAFKSLKDYIDRTGDTNLKQALQRVELQVGPTSAAPQIADQTGLRPISGEPAMAAAERSVEAPKDNILHDPEEAFRTEVRQALIDTMLEHSSPLNIGPDEWLTIAARRIESRLAPDNSTAKTMMIRAKGSDLTSYRAGQITKDEAVKRVEVRMF